MTDKYVIQVLVAGTSLGGLFSFALISFILAQKRKQNAHYAERERLQRALIEERERTMNEIASEIHDHISQIVSFAQMNLKVALDTENKSEVEALIHRVNKMLAEIGDDLQNMGHSLSSDYIMKHGLFKVLDHELDYLNSHKLACHFEIEGDRGKLGIEKELVVYRIAQEAIHNVIKHSRATELDVTLRFEGETFTMIIADNGIGFMEEDTHEKNGIGIINMRQRAKLLNAELKIDSSPSGGATISLYCPKI